MRFCNCFPHHLRHEGLENAREEKWARRGRWGHGRLKGRDGKMKVVATKKIRREGGHNGGVK